MPPDLSQMSDEELAKIAGQAPTPIQAPEQPSGVSALTDEQLAAIAGQPEPLATPKVEPISQPSEAAKFGLQRFVAPLVQLSEKIPSVTRGLGRFGMLGPLTNIAKQVAADEGLRPQTDYAPQTVTDQLISYSVSDLPTLLASGPLTKAGTFAASQAARLGLSRLPQIALKVGTTLGLGAAASKTLEQAQEGQIPNPVDVAKSFGTGFIIGSFAGPVGSLIADRVRQFKIGPAIKKAEQAVEQFEGATPKAQQISPVEAIQARNVNRKLERIESRIAQESQIASNTELPPIERKAAQGRVAQLTRDHINKQLEFQDIIEGPAFKQLQEAKDHLGSRTVQVNGRAVPAFEQTLSRRGIVVKPEEASQLLGAADIPKFQSSAFGTQDIIRLAQTADKGQLRGPVRQLIVEPVENAARKFEQEAVRYETDLANKIKELALDLSPERQRLLFRVAEGRELPARLTFAERDFVNYTKKLYSDLFDKMNNINAVFGLPQIAKRQNYVTHLQELNFLQKLGVGPEMADKLEGLASPFARKVRTSFAFEKERLGGEFQENLVNAVQGYLRPSLRRINMQQAASAVQTRARFLPPNMRKAVDNWIQGPVLGGLDPKDMSLIQSGAEPVLRAAEGLSSVLTRGAIAGNLRIAVQQPSQVLATAVTTGIRPMLRGLGAAFVQPPKQLLRTSTFLTGRTIRDELVPVTSSTLKTFDKFAGAITEYTDRYVARASWYAGFMRAKELGLSDQASVRMADDIGRMLHGSYQQYLKPAILRGRSGRAFLPFQTFTFNLWNFLTKDPRILAEMKNSSKLRETLKVVAGIVATNQIYDAMGLPAPFALTIPKEATLPESIRAVGESTKMIPLVGSVLGGRNPSPTLDLAAQEVSGIVNPDGNNQAIFGNLAKAIFTDDEDERDKALVQAGSKAGRLLPVGSQLVNTITGLMAAQKGYYSVGHSEVDLDELDKAMAVLLGPTATTPVREEFRQRALGKIREKYKIDE